MTRAQYIRDHYRLSQLPDGRWEAVSEHGGIHSQTGEPWYSYTAFRGDRAAVIGEARRQWGHLNFEDEAAAFVQIFPGGQGSYGPVEREERSTKIDAAG